MANIELGRYVADRGGATLIEADATQNYAYPRVNSETKVLDYVVPSNKKFTAESLLVTLYHQQIPQNAITFGLTNRTAIIKIKVGGTDYYEASLTNQGLPNNVGGGDEQVSPGYQANQSFSFGDGITIPSGTAVAVTFQTTSGFQSVVGKATLVGAIAGTTDVRKGSALLAVTGETTIVTYTPGADYTLYSVYFDADKHDMLWGGVSVALDGVVVYELNMAMNQDSQCVVEPLIYPLFGIELYPGQRVTVAADPIAPHGGVMTASLFGKQEDLGGGGGSSAFSFAFVG